MKIHSLCLEIKNIFSPNAQIKKISEDFERVVYEWTINESKLSLPNKIELKEKNERDDIFLSLTDNNDETISFNSKNICESWGNFFENIDQLDFEEQINVKLEISKPKTNNRISIYQLDEFVNYILQLSLVDFLSILNKQLFSCLILEIQDEKFQAVSSDSIFFIPKDGETNKESLINDDIRKLRVEKSRNLCCCDLEKYNLIPEDFYISTERHNDTKSLNNLFKKICTFLSYLFIFDYSKLNSTYYSYRLNGFKTVKYNFDVKTIKNFNIETTSCDKIYEIYRWIYIDGNTADKLNIARNILSLNISYNTLQVEPSTIDAIHSNYRISEKENVKQYIQVRNDLSELLIDLQSKIDDIVDNFVGDFKKNVITLLSFFISVIVINVIANGKYVEGFSNDIIVLIFAFLTISFLFLLYSRWEISKKMELFEKHYQQIKERYKDILSKNELKEIFNDCDPLSTKSHKNFIESQKELYSVIWFVSLVILLVATIEIYNYNNGFSSYLLKLINFFHY